MFYKVLAQGIYMQGERSIRWTEAEEVEEVDAASLGPGIQPSDLEIDDVVEKKEAIEYTLPAPKKQIKQSEEELPALTASKDESKWKIIEEGSTGWGDDDEGKQAEVQDLEPADKGKLYEKGTKDDRSTKDDDLSKPKDVKVSEVPEQKPADKAKLYDQGTIDDDSSKNKSGTKGQEAITDDIEEEEPLQANLYDKVFRKETNYETAEAEAEVAELEKGYRSLLVDQHPLDAYDASEDDAGAQADIEDLEDDVQQAKIYDKVSRSISEIKAENTPAAYDLRQDSRAQIAERNDKDTGNYDSSAHVNLLDMDKSKLGTADIEEESEDEEEEEKPDGK